MRRYIFVPVLCFMASHAIFAQDMGQLKALENHKLEVFYSDGFGQRTSLIAARVERALEFYQELLQFKPTVTLLVLSTADWRTHTTVPVVYGMPHYNEKTKTLVVAAEDNPFWRSFVPPDGQLPDSLSEQIQTVYKDDDDVSMKAFFDLLAIHELGHAFHDQAGLTMQRKWMGELFANILLHTFVAEEEPASLPALTTFPQMVILGGTKEFKYTSLRDIESRYDEIGEHHPKNYGWYQSRWHAAAADIYNATGIGVVNKLWVSLKNQNEFLQDEAFTAFLSNNVDKSVGDVMRHWDRDTVK